jgi:hypothetical protein
MPIDKAQVQQQVAVAQQATGQGKGFRELCDKLEKQKNEVDKAVSQMSDSPKGSREDNYNRYLELNNTKNQFYLRLRQAGGFANPGIGAELQGGPQGTVLIAEPGKDAKKVEDFMSLKFDPFFQVDEGDTGVDKGWKGWMAVNPDSPVDQNLAKALDTQFLQTYKVMRQQLEALKQNDSEYRTTATTTEYDEFVKAKDALEKEIAEMEAVIKTRLKANGLKEPKDLQDLKTIPPTFFDLVQKTDNKLEQVDKHYYRRAKKDLVLGIVENSRSNERAPFSPHLIENVSFSLWVENDEKGEIVVHAERLPCFTNRGIMYGEGAQIGALIHARILSVPETVEDYPIDENGNLDRTKPKVKRPQQVMEDVYVTDAMTGEKTPVYQRTSDGKDLLKDGKRVPEQRGTGKLVYKFQGGGYETWDRAFTETTIKVGGLSSFGGGGLAAQRLLDKVALAEAMGSKMDPELYDPKQYPPSGFNPSKLKSIASSSGLTGLEQQAFIKKLVTHGVPNLAQAVKRVDKQVFEPQVKEQAKFELMKAWENDKANGKKTKRPGKKEIDAKYNDLMKEYLTLKNSTDPADQEKAKLYRQDKIRARFVDRAEVSHDLQEANKFKTEQTRDEAMRINAEETTGLTIKVKDSNKPPKTPDTRSGAEQKEMPKSKAYIGQSSTGQSSDQSKGYIKQSSTDSTSTDKEKKSPKSTM